ncbi:MAG TPA: hypothetical protein EYP78_03750 [Candidatus Omnitrophica bacterium]|nr:hypothetical protein [Candidatus Omnitrophota bacterium]
MVLQYLRKKTRLILVGTLIIIIPAFAIFYGWRSSGPEEIPYIIAKVGRTPITRGEYLATLENLRERYRQLFGSSYSSEIEKQLAQQALNELIEKYLQLREAKVRRVRVGEEEVLKNFREYPLFHDENGKFDKEKVMRINKLYPQYIKELEERIRMELTIEKLKNTITHSVEVSEDEIYDYFRLSRSKVKVKYLYVAPYQITDNVEVSDTELEYYYQNNKNSFMEGPEVRLEYVLVPEGIVKEDEIEITSEEIESYYAEYQQEWIKDDTEPLPLSVVKDEVEERLKKKEKEKILRDKAFQISLKLLDVSNWNSFAHDEALSYGTTGFIREGGVIPELGSSLDITRTAFSLPVNEISEPLKIERQGYAMIKPLEKKPATVPPYEQIVEKVKEKLIEEKKWDLAEKQAKEVYSQLKGDRTMEEVAEDYKLEVKETGYFSRAGFIEKIGYVPQITVEAFRLDVGEYSEPIVTQQGIFIIQPVERKEPPDEEFQEMKESIKSLLLYQKKQEVFSEWLEEIKEKNKEKIVILWDELLPAY